LNKTFKKLALGGSLSLRPVAGQVPSLRDERNAFGVKLLGFQPNVSRNEKKIEKEKWQKF